MCYVVGKDISHALDDSIELWETLTQEDNSFFLKYVHGCPLCETTPTTEGGIVTPALLHGILGKLIA